MKTPNFDDLSKRIEQLIAAHMEQCRTATLQAVGRAFAVTSESSKSSSLASAVGSSSATPKRRKMAPRRGAEEVAALSQKLYEQVCVAPGTTMAALALRLDTPAKILHLPMSALKRDGKVRHVGERSQTRYFPQSGEAAGGA